MTNKDLMQVVTGVNLRLLKNYHLIKEWDGNCPKCKSSNIEHDPEIAGMGRCKDCNEYISKNYIVCD